AVLVELPVVAHLPHEVHVEVADEELLVLGRTALADEVALRVDDLARAVEEHRLVAVLVVLEAEPVRLEHEVAVRDGGRGTLDLPEAVAESRLRRVRVEDEVRTIQPVLAPALREVPVVADVRAERADRGLEDGIPEVHGTEVELLSELLDVRDVDLAVLAEI